MRRHIAIMLALVWVILLTPPGFAAQCEYWQCAQYTDPIQAQCELRFGGATGDYAIGCRVRCYRYSDGSIAYCGCSYDYCYSI